MKGSIIMAKKKIIHVNVITNRSDANQVAIPYDINEIELKALLRDLGYISSYRFPYLTTKVYLEDKGSQKEICIDEYRSLKELGIKEDSRIIIRPGESEPISVRRSLRDMRCLYGCPMAQSVEEAISQAERYSEEESVVITGSIYE